MHLVPVIIHNSFTRLFVNFSSSDVIETKEKLHTEDKSHKSSPIWLSTTILIANSLIILAWYLCGAGRTIYI